MTENLNNSNSHRIDQPLHESHFMERLSPFIQQFLAELAEDHPELAQEISTHRLPTFINNMPELWHEFLESLKKKSVGDSDSGTGKDILEQESPNSTFAENLVLAINQLRYISKPEAINYMNIYRSEVEHELAANPGLIILFDTDYFKDSSETYFAQMILDGLPTQFHNRIYFSGDIDHPVQNWVDSQNEIVIYRGASHQ